MDGGKDIRWKQRFINFQQAYNLLATYRHQSDGSELERAGVIQFFEICFELAWKMMKDYLESHQLRANSPRETIKLALQIELIEDGHVWIDALTDWNRTVHTYNQVLAKKMARDIAQVYFPVLEKLYKRLLEEL